MADLTFTTTYLDALSRRAEQEPLGIDIGYFSVEERAGFLAGQAHAIEHLLANRAEFSSGEVAEECIRLRRALERIERHAENNGDEFTRMLARAALGGGS